MNYRCQKCSGEFLKWSGRCPNCGEWDSLEEFVGSGEMLGKGSVGTGKNAKPAVLKKIGVSSSKTASKRSKASHGGESMTGRYTSSIKELDRVLGGGFVEGEVVLVGGQPGIGKSTLLLQVALGLSKDKKVIYVSGEESLLQLESRAERLGVASDNFFVIEETEVETIVATLEKEMPDLIIVDSIQAMRSSSYESYPGSISQVRVCGGILSTVAKKLGITAVIVGQITKEGNIAGPKVLEHLVDAVMYMEGDEFNTFRILRSIKNRFGATNEIGVFKMGDSGLVEVENPSEAFLEKNDRTGVPGTAIGAILKGSRVIFVEVQALTIDRDVEGVPLRRVANGIKKPRLDMLCAVLTRRSRINIGSKDVYVNIVGGLVVDEPSLDLAICAAIYSAVKDKVLPRDKVFLGEVGLTGQVRGFWGADRVVKEADRMGYKNIVLSSSVESSGHFKIATNYIDLISSLS